MKNLTTQTRSDSGVDLRNLNALVQLLKSGEHVTVGPGLCKSVIGGVVCVSLPGLIAPEPTPFEVVKTARTKVKVSGGRIYMNGKEFEFAESAEVAITATCNIAMQWLVQGDEATILASQEILLPTTVPTWSATKRFRILAKIVFENGGITRIEDRRMDIHVDDVLPRPEGTDEEQDFRVPIFNKTGWGDVVPAGAVGYVANIVRMTAGDVE